MDTFVNIHQDLKDDALTNRQPMQLSQVWKLLLLYLVTVTCTYVEISLGSCWQKDDCMGQRSTINHNVQLFYKFKQPICNHPMATIRCTNKVPMVFYYS